MSKNKNKLSDYTIIHEGNSQRVEDTQWQQFRLTAQKLSPNVSNWLEPKTSYIDVLLSDTKFNFEHPTGEYVKYHKRPISVRKKRENMLLKAVRNLYKRINFLQISIDLLNDFITEQDFEREILENENKYVVSLADLRNQFEAEVISDLVQALNIKLDVNEVSELFGITADSLYECQGIDKKYFIE